MIKVIISFLLVPSCTMAQHLQPLPKSTIIPVIVDGARILIPNPSDYFLVTPAMGTYYKYQSTFIAEANHQYAFFAPDSIRKYLSVDSIVLMKRSFRVQSMKNMKYPQNISFQAYFDLLKEKSKQSLNSIILKNIPDYNRQISKKSNNLLNIFKYDPHLAIASTFPVPGFDETPHSLTTTMYYRISGIDSLNYKINKTLTASYSILGVKNRLLFIYTYGQEQDIKWVQQACRDYTQQIFLLNQPVKTEARKKAKSQKSKR